MTAEQFAYWLHGFAELNTEGAPDQEQWRVIRDHLNLVFTKVTPAYPPTPQQPGLWGPSYIAPATCVSVPNDTDTRLVC